MSETHINETLNKLSDSLTQQATASINNLIVPEFRGLPDEDVCEFLARFKMATLTLPSNHRCIALNKALKGAAMVWAKSNIKTLMNSCDWKSIKTKMIERFDHPDRKLRYRERLSKLKFDRETSTLMSYVELFLELHNKAFGLKKSTNQEITDAVQALRINLPDQIVKGLNTLEDKWTEYKNSEELINLIRRYELKIMPYESKYEQSGPTLTKNELVDMLKELRDQVRSDMEKQKEELTVQTKALATMVSQPSQPSQTSNQAQQSTKREFNSFNPNQSYRRSYRNQYQFNRFKRPRFEPKDNPKQIESSGRKDTSNVDNKVEDHRNVSSTPNEERDMLIAAYTAKFGQPPSTCELCQGAHHRKHCPLLVDNLN